MRFFRKLGLSAFALWLAFLVVLNPIVHAQMEIKALEIDVANWPTHHTGICNVSNYFIDCELLNSLPQQLLTTLTSNYPNIDKLPWAATISFSGSSSNGGYFDADISLGVNLKNENFYIYFTPVSDTSFELKGSFQSLIGSYYYFTAKYRYYQSGENANTGSFVRINKPSRTFDSFALNMFGNYATGSKHYGNEGVSALYGTGFTIIAQPEFCTYTVPRETIKQSDIVALQEYDKKNGTSLASKAEQLSTSVFDKYSAFTALFVPLVQELQKESELSDLSNRLTGTSSSSGWYKDDNGKLHSYGGGVSRGGGAGRDYTGGSSTEHVPKACFDSEQITFLPVGDVSVTPNFSNPSQSTTENIYYVTNEYYVTNNYEIIEKVESEEKPPATGTDTDIPPIVNPGDDWPEDTPGWIEFLGNLISGLLQGLGDAIGGLGSAIGGIANALGNIISSLITALTDLFKTLFVPSSEFLSNSFTGIKDNFESKFPFLDQADEVENSIIGTIQGADDTAPSYEMELPEILGGGSVQVFDFSFYDQYRDLINGGILFFAWATFIMRLPRKLSKAIGGVN